MHFFAGNIPRLFKRISERGYVPWNVFERAALATHEACSIRTAVRDFTIDRMSSKCFVDKHAKNLQTVIGDENCRIKNMMCTPRNGDRVCETY